MVAHYGVQQVKNRNKSLEKEFISMIIKKGISKLEEEYPLPRHTEKNAFILTDSSGKILAANENIEKILKYNETELLGRSFLSLFTPQIQGHLLAVFNSLSAISTKTGREFSVLLSSFELMDKNGSKIPIKTYLAQLNLNNKKYFLFLFKKDSKKQEKIEKTKKITERISSYAYNILDFFPEATILFDAEGKIIYCNNAAKEILGYEKNELIGKKITSLFSKKYRKWFEEKHLPFLRSLKFFKPHYHLEKEVVTKDGETIKMETRVSIPKHTDKKDFLGIVTLKPIFSIKTGKILLPSGKELKETSEAFKELLLTSLDHANYGLIILNPKMKIVWVNKWIERFYGLKKEETIGRGKKEIIKEKIKWFFENPDEFERRILETYEKNLYLSKAIFHVLPGEKRMDKYVEYSSYPITAGDFQGGRIEIYYDVTERVEKERELEQLKEFNERIVESLNEGLLLENEKGKIIFVNSKLCEMLGYNEKELINHHWSKIVPEKYLKIVQEETDKRPYGVASTYETFLLTKEGKEIPVIVSATPLFENGVYKGVISSLIEIKERKELEEKLRKSYEELSSFAHHVSHELKEPLRSMTLFSICLKEKLEKIDVDQVLRKEMDDYLSRVIKAGKRLNAMVNETLKLASVEAETEPPEPIDLNELLNDVLFDLEALIREKNAKIVVEKPLPKIMGRKTQICEVFQNLVSNALKFNDKPNPRVEIGYRKENMHSVFYVKDNGIGMKEEDITKIFIPFLRLKNSREYPGTGLGLSVVKKIIERHNGKIWVESQPGKGSTFFFTLPSALLKKSSSPASPLGGGGGSTQDKKK